MADLTTAKRDRTLSASGIQHLANVCGLAAQTSVARVVEPSQLEVVHPPAKRGSAGSGLDLDGAEINKGMIKHNRCKAAFNQT